MAFKWMVDVHGDSGEGSKETMKEAMDDGNFIKYIDAHGSLASAVQNCINENGYKISDRGGGDGIWDIGVPFDELDDAIAYLVLMTNTFSKAIGYGLLRFSLNTWSRSCWK